MDGKNEQLSSSQEKSIEVSKSANKQLEKIGAQPESSVELSPRDLESRTEKARVEALETAISVESGGKEKSETKDPGSRRGPIGKREINKSFKQTIKRVQAELPVGSRTFSKIIHNKAIEKTSDALGSTIARPNAMLAGAFVAFILSLLTYTVAKTVGYTLSGFETIAAFIIGWIIGVVYDYFRVLFTGKKF